MPYSRMWLSFLGTMGGVCWTFAYRSGWDWWWITAAGLLTAGVVGETLVEHAWQPQRRA